MKLKFNFFLNGPHYKKYIGMECWDYVISISFGVFFLGLNMILVP